MTDLMDAPVVARKTSLWHRLYHGETSYDFVGRRRIWFLISGTVILIGVVSLLLNGLNLGIEFKGGTAYTVKAPGVSVAKARDTLRKFGLGDAKIQVAGSNTLDIEGPRFKGTPEQIATKQKEVAAALAKLGHTTEQQVTINDVGPSFGKTVSNKARTALIAFVIAITIYISFRFEWKMAISAIIAVLHDILVTVGVYSVTRFEVTPATVVAFLTILGYSLYDTVVVFDKVQENTRGLSASGRMTYGDTVNLSMNQVLMRSINTSLVAIMPILSILIIGAYGLGATTLKDFGLALLVGLLTGAYSSIFVASPILAMLKEREPRYSAIRQRVLSRGPAASAPLTPAAAAAMYGGGDSPRAAAGAGAPLRPGGAERPMEEVTSGARASGGRPLPVNRPRPGNRPGGRPRPPQNGERR